MRASDRPTIERVLAAHPKHVGRPAGRLRPDHFTLRDGQVVIARERGHDTWRHLVEAHDPTLRWPARPGGIVKRAFDEAIALDHGYCSDLHLLLALLNPPAPTVALDVLTEVALSHDDVAQRCSEWSPARRGGAGRATQEFDAGVRWLGPVGREAQVIKPGGEPVFGHRAGPAAGDPLGDSGECDSPGPRRPTRGRTHRVAEAESASRR